MKMHICYSAFIQKGAAANQAMQDTSMIALTGSMVIAPNMNSNGGTIVPSNAR